MTIRIIFLALILVTFASCSKSNSDPGTNFGPPTVVSYPIENTKFKNCHFKDASPSYSVNSPITSNPISCDEGVAKSVQVLTTTTLPAGLSFSMDSLSLVGTPTEKVTAAPYDFYIENEAGYLILRLTLTVK